MSGDLRAWKCEGGTNRPWFGPEMTRSISSLYRLCSATFAQVAGVCRGQPRVSSTIWGRDDQEQDED